MSFLEIEAWCGELVPEDSFYARMNRYGDSWFRDEDFAGIYKDSNLGVATNIICPPEINFI